MIKSFDSNIIDGTVYTPTLDSATTSSNGIAITSLDGGAAGLAFNANDTLDATTTAITIGTYGIYDVDDSYLVDDFSVVLVDGTFVTGNFSDESGGVISAGNLSTGQQVSTPETRRKHYLGYV